MQMDGAALFAAAYEASDTLAGGRIDRIVQPNRHEVVFTVRTGGKNHRLLFSANPESARVHLCKSVEKGPDTPFSFLMMLRKHLTHGRVLSIDAPMMDRVIHMKVQVVDDLGDLAVVDFIAECMGKHSNLILVDPDGIVLDCAKRVPPAVSSLRTVLPGERYHKPPVQNKRNVLELDAPDIAALLTQVPGGTMAKALVSLFYGISPFTARQLCLRAGLADVRAPLQRGDANRLAQSIFSLTQSLKTSTFTPSIQTDADGAPIAFAPFRIMGDNVRIVASMWEAMIAYTSFQRDQRRILRERHALQSAVNARLQRLYKRLAIQQDAIADSASYEDLRQEGEFLLAYAHKIKRGSETANVYDYVNDRQVELRLDPTLSAADNAAKRFRRYQKLKATAQAAQKQRSEILRDIEYWEGISLAVEQSEDLDSLLEIRDELKGEGLLRSATTKSKGSPNRTSRPLRFLSSDGVEIFAGRNNAQNDQVTVKIGKSGDTWMHAQGMPGSHVLIKANPVPSDTLWQAAHIAAYFSRAKHSANVPIDYTLIKNVHKPSGAKPGFVTYTGQKTMFVTPDAALVKSMIQADPVH